MFPTKSASISVAIPESDNSDNDNDANNSVDKAPKSNSVDPGLRVARSLRVSDRAQIKGQAEPTIEEEEAPVPESDAMLFFESALEDDVPKRVDWRQFCIEVLDGHSDA